jgi:4-hydroxybenzoate polyprenyltransferase
LLLATGFSYSCRIVPWFTAGKGFRVIRVKEVPLVKNLIVSFLWSASILAMPVLFASGSLHGARGMYYIAGALFLMIFNNTLVHDVMDEPGDRVAGIATVPTLMGGRKSLMLLWALDGIWTLFIAGLVFAGRLQPGLAVFLILLTGFPAIYSALWAWGKSSRAVVDFLSESDLVVFSAGMLLLSMR